MDRLILFRHGKAEPESATGGDFDRRLDARGEREVAEMGHRLVDLGVRPDLALVSPSARTRETWAGVAATFGDPEVRFEEDLYLAEAGGIWRAAERAGAGVATVMVVGHNPGLHELTLQLMLEGSTPAELMARAQRRFPPASVAVFRLEPGGRPAADGLFYPER